MNNKAQVFVITIWILVMLALLTIGVSHRVSMALYLSQYHKDRLKALYLSKAAVEVAIANIEKDDWVDNSEDFKKILLNENENEFAAVSYTKKQGVIDEPVFGVIDEESKININTASLELLLAFLERYQINNALNIANNILIWRGDMPDINKIYEQSGYSSKGSHFSNIEELNLIQGLTTEDYQKIKGLVTVYGQGLVNINTVSSEVLTLVVQGIARDLSIKDNFVDNLITKIINFRNTVGGFKGKDDIKIELTGDEELNLFNKLVEKIIFQSNNFLIEVTGNVSKIRSKVSVVYNRKDKKISYWHES